jgi:hypothetical protein
MQRLHGRKLRGLIAAGVLGSAVVLAALGTALRLASTTSPDIEPLVVCANTAPVSNNESARTMNKVLI